MSVADKDKNCVTTAFCKRCNQEHDRPVGAKCEKPKGEKRDKSRDARLWGHLWSNRHVQICSDNMSAVYVCNTGKT